MSRTAAIGIAVLTFAGQVMAQERPATTSPVTLTMQETLHRVLARAPEVALARAQADRAVQAVRETRSSNLPQVVTGTGLAYNNGFPLSIEGAAPSLIQIGVSQSIFSKRNKNLIREAEEGSKASGIGTEAAENDLAAQWALVYYELHTARKAAKLWEERIDAALEQQHATETLLEAGRVRPVDLTLAQTAVQDAQQQLFVAREQARVAETELDAAAGLAEGTEIRTVEPEIDAALLGVSADDLYHRSLETNPGIRQAEATVAAKEFHVEAEKGEAYPQLQVVSQYALFSRTNNYQDFFNRFTRNNFLFGLSVQIPLFNGFRTGSRVAQSQQEVLESRLQVQRLKGELRRSVERGLSALSIARGARALASKQLQAARQLLEVSETLLQGGRLAMKDLDDVRNQVRQKELAQLEADRALFEREIELLRTIGSVGSIM